MTHRTVRPLALAALIALVAASGCAFTDSVVTPSGRTIDEDVLYFVGEREGRITFAAFELRRTYRERSFGSPYVQYAYQGVASDGGVWKRFHLEQWTEWEGNPGVDATDMLQLVLSTDREVDLYFEQEDGEVEVRIKSKPMAIWRRGPENGPHIVVGSAEATLTYMGLKREGWLVHARVRGAVSGAYDGLDATVVWDRRGNWWLVGDPALPGLAGELVLYGTAREDAVQLGAGTVTPIEDDALEVEIPEIELFARLGRHSAFDEDPVVSPRTFVGYVGRAGLRGRDRRVFGLSRPRFTAPAPEIEASDPDAEDADDPS